MTAQIINFADHQRRRPARPPATITCAFPILTWWGWAWIIFMETPA